jgi:hypothetical protein
MKREWENGRQRDEEAKRPRDDEIYKQCNSVATL